MRSVEEILDSDVMPRRTELIKFTLWFQFKQFQALSSCNQTKSLWEGGLKVINHDCLMLDRKITVISIGRSPRTICAPTSSDILRAARNYPSGLGSQFHKKNKNWLRLCIVFDQIDTSSPNGRFTSEEILEEKTAKRRRRARAVWPPKFMLRPIASKNPLPLRENIPDRNFWPSSLELPLSDAYMIPALKLCNNWN